MKILSVVMLGGSARNVLEMFERNFSFLVSDERTT
jgi:hypothetical protein